MTGEDFLAVADSLLEGNSEADWRSAVSRAYYGAFHVARHLLLQCGFLVVSGEQAHAFLWMRLANSGHPDVVAAGKDLSELRRNRNWADYELERAYHHDVAAKQVRTALDLAHLLHTVSAEPVVLSRITEAIKTYEHDILHQVTWQA